MRRFNEINIGDSERLVHSITQEDIDRFVNLTGDDNKLHVDARFASKTSFKKPVAHGMLGAAFISTVIGTKLPGDGALWFSQSLEFLQPVRVGDEITVTAEVVNKVERDQTIELKTEIFNQNGQKVTTGVAKVKVIETAVTEPVAAPETGPKSALVLGASGGIGREVAIQLAKNGFNLVLHYNTNSQVVESLKDQFADLNIDCISHSADITDERSVNDLVSLALRKFDKIDVLINCTTVSLPTVKFGNLKWEDIENHLRINIKSNFFLVKAIAPGMQERKTGKLIFLTSQATDGAPPTDMLHYVTAKSALNGFVKSIAVELAPFNINVNLVSPGMTDTDLIANIPEKVRLITASKAPLRRLATASDVASAVAFLASNGSDFIAGETIRVNGGISMV